MQRLLRASVSPESKCKSQPLAALPGRVLLAKKAVATAAFLPASPAELPTSSGVTVQERKASQNPSLVTKQRQGLHTGRKQLEGRAGQEATKASNMAKCFKINACM